MRTLYGRNTSINVQKAAWALGELGLEFDWVDRNGSVGSINTPEYLKLNEAAQIPTIVDGEIILRQSNAIVRYLSHTYSEGDLSPLDQQAYAEAERWMEWQSTDCWDSMRPVFWGLVRKAPEERNMELIQENIDESHRQFGFLNDFLKDRQYIAGESFSMGDIPAGCAVNRYYALPAEHMNWPDLPHLKRWYEGLCERVPYKEYVMVPLQ